MTKIRYQELIYLFIPGRALHKQGWDRTQTGTGPRLEPGSDWNWAQAGTGLRLEPGPGRNRAQAGTGPRLEPGSDWNQAKAGTGLRLGPDSGWDRAQAGTWPRLELGQGWNWAKATTGPRPGLGLSPNQSVYPSLSQSLGLICAWDSFSLCPSLNTSHGLNLSLVLV